MSAPKSADSPVVQLPGQRGTVRTTIRREVNAALTPRRTVTKGIPPARAVPASRRLSRLHLTRRGRLARTAVILTAAALIGCWLIPTAHADWAARARWCAASQSSDLSCLVIGALS